MEPLSYIDPSIVPGFNGQLTDKTKVFGFAWKTTLPLLYDPEQKYTVVENINIRPTLASQFLHARPSSDKHAKTTFVFSIEKNAYKEVTGNVSLAVRLAAFNHNHSTYVAYLQSERQQNWRWRRATEYFNVTILPPFSAEVEQDTYGFYLCD
jgi:hypothetical protein